MGLFKKKVKEENQLPVFVGNTPMEKLQNLIIKNPGINLKKGEVCLYRGNAKSYHVKNVVTGYKGGNSGVNIRIAKGVSYHTGGSGKQAIRENVKETYPAEFYVTNMRMILVSVKYGFDLSVLKIIQSRFSDNHIEFFTGSKTHFVLTNDSRYIEQLFQLMNEAFNEQEN
jgi:hypothetical protein